MVQRQRFLAEYRREAVATLKAPSGFSGSVNINALLQFLNGALVSMNLVYSQAGWVGGRRVRGGSTRPVQ